MLFVRKINRRKVLQVTAVYAVVAWLIIQIFDFVREPLNLPDWLDTVVNVLLAVGFPFAIVLAWAGAMTDKTTERPILIQGSEAPIVRIDDGGDSLLLCAACNSSVLVEGYRPECLVGIGLQCKKCGHVTWTPSLQPGETLHFKVVTLGSSGKFLIGSTVQQDAKVTVTCDQELAMASAETHPRLAEARSLDLSQDGLAAVASELDLLSGGRLGAYMKSADRSIAHGERYFRQNPLAWAIRYLSRQLDNGTLQMHEDTFVAIGIIESYRHVLFRWRHHACFPNLAQELCSSFHHTLSQLIAASYLSDHDNVIAFNLPQPNSGRSADLYVRLSAIDKLYLEVKCPEAVEWPNLLDKQSKMKETVEKCLSNARGQIGTSNPGVLVIGASCMTRGFFENFDSAIRTTLRNHGTRHRGVAAVALVGLNELEFQWAGSNSAKFSAGYRVVISKNPHYFKDNPIIT